VSDIVPAGSGRPDRLTWTIKKEASEMTGTPRHVFILMATQSLPYARVCITTMLRNTLEPIHLRLVADNAAEKALLEAEIPALNCPTDSRITVIAKEEVAARLEDRFPGMQGLRQLHDGHPCWRKIIDPIVLSAPEDEIIVADPDLFFPNHFTFEPTPDDGVMMMWQSPNCMYPPEAVCDVFSLDVPLANHVDIGVAHVRAGAVDLDWLDWFVGSLDLDRYRPFMHIEAIVWSALAMRMGGTHLNPSAWRCWERGRIKRLAVAAGVPGRWTMLLEPLAQVKCIHVSGPSKWWVTEALKTGFLKEQHNRHADPVPGLPYVELRPEHFEREQRLKKAAGALGFYRLTKNV
jgi:hypothetical protein